MGKGGGGDNRLVNQALLGLECCRASSTRFARRSSDPPRHRAARQYAAQTSCTTHLLPITDPVVRLRALRSALSPRLTKQLLSPPSPSFGVWFVGQLVQDGGQSWISGFGRSIQSNGSGSSKY